MPAEFLARYSYFNVGVSSDVNSALNPWNILRAVARPSDHVSIKLDVDAPAIEMALFKQLLNDGQLIVNARRN